MHRRKVVGLHGARVADDLRPPREIGVEDHHAEIREHRALRVGETGRVVPHGPEVIGASHERATAREWANATIGEVKTASARAPGCGERDHDDSEVQRLEPRLHAIADFTA